jgi:succinate-semialdehyde dehydrogenase / glutarate-semialdehyde dehydrogenase
LYLTTISMIVASFFVRRPGNFRTSHGMLALLQASKGTLGLAVRNISHGLSSMLNDPSLVVPSDASKDTAAGPTFSVFDPASPDAPLLAEIPSMGKTEAQDAIQKSATILPAWRDKTTASVRSNLLRKWSDLVKENADDLATIMTLESGKPKAESLGEVNYAASFLDYYAGEAIRPTGAGGGFVVPSSFAAPDGAPRGQMLAIQQAVGVTALITPWNFPLAMITRKVGPALAAGCTVVVKPSELTPLSAIALQTLAGRAGIPEDVVQVM